MTKYLQSLYTSLVIAASFSLAGQQLFGQATLVTSVSGNSRAPVSVNLPASRIPAGAFQAGRDFDTTLVSSDYYNFTPLVSAPPNPDIAVGPDDIVMVVGSNQIARFPNRFQRQCVGDVRASYARRADGRIDVVNRCRTVDGQTEARGVARLVDEQTHAKLKVRFAPAWLSWLPPVWGDYWIIGLAPDYSWAVVGDPGREYLWILARTPRLEAESIAAARTAAQDNGFDVGRLVQTPQETRRP